MIKSILVDDEPKASEVLELLLNRNCPEIQIVGTATNIEDAYDLISTEKPSLVFLDINMPKGTGLDLVERIAGKTNVKFIFVTAYDEFAIRAFRLSAIDYLLKPVDRQETDSGSLIGIKSSRQEFNAPDYYSMVSDILAKKKSKENCH